MIDPFYRVIGDIAVSLLFGSRLEMASVDRLGEMDESHRSAADSDLLRSHEYSLLSVLLGRVPDAETIGLSSHLRGDASPLGIAHIALAHEALASRPADLDREFFALFIGVGRGELVPYASYYLTGFLQERPLAELRRDLAALGIARVGNSRDPEDHIAFLCEVMAGVTAGRFDVEPGTDRVFFQRHIEPWAGRFFSDLETASQAKFYRPVGAIGRMFMEIEAQAYALDHRMDLNGSQKPALEEAR